MLRLTALLVLVLALADAARAVIVGIDYGTDWFKVALKQPGASLDLVLNRESKRKTASHVLIRDQERLFGNDATSL
ncbi:hypothetical protein CAUPRSCDRAFT_9327, partial [Caulochytrium protostelioides]